MSQLICCRGSVDCFGGEVAHQPIDLAGGHGHGKPLDCADFLFGDALLPGHAKVVLDSWHALPGDGRRQSDDGHGSFVQVPLVAHGIIEVDVGFMLFRRQHD